MHLLNRCDESKISDLLQVRSDTGTEHQMSCVGNFTVACSEYA